MNQRSSQLSLSKASWWRLSVLVAVALCAALWLTVSASAQAQSTATPPPGYNYTVQQGDSWETVSQRTGVPVDQLKEANPEAVRDTGWLLNGETLFIPTSVAAQNKTHVVKEGESWASIAQRYGVPISLLRAANPQSIRAGFILLRGEVLVIPPLGAPVPTAVPTAGATVTATAPVSQGVGATPSPSATPTSEPSATPTPTEEPTQEPTEEPTEEPTAVLSETAPAITATEEATAAATITPAEEALPAEPVTGTAPVTATEEVTGTAGPSFDLPECPEEFAGYPEQLADVINRNADGAAAVTAFLSGCQALVDDGEFAGDLNGDGQDDLVVVYQNPSEDQVFVEGDLAIFNSSPDGLALSYRARAAGEVRLLSVEDVNGDSQIDVVWVDTTCGASTCFDTVNVRSWDGSMWADWTDGTITMAYADIKLNDAAAEGEGNEIVLSGGIYGSVGAGPQRSRVETWASVDGAPYTLLEKAYSESECLYHTVLDANRAFLDGPNAGFEAAKALYAKAATDDALIKCWVRTDELAELRSFSLFRLALIAGYEGDAEGAAARIGELTAAYPGSTYDEVGQLWLQGLQANDDAAAACGDVTAYVEENPAAWEMLADYGYTNPSFEAADVCPVLEIGGAGGEEATPPPGEAGGAGGGATPTPAPESSSMIPEEGEAATAASSACPAELAGYADALPAVLDAAQGDQAAVESWLQGCDALAEGRGALLFAQIDDDGLPDALVFPTLITDLGYGPNGAQGAVLIYHTAPDGVYTLVASPKVYGQPAPLAVDDLNADGRMDVAWTVTGCSTFCVVEVQMGTWDGDAYLALIQPGATIAEGTARFAPANGVGEGQQLVLEGGVSGVPEGGLEVPRTEVWQSVDGGLYQRVSWTYDRGVAGNDCLGLRLVEADVALHAEELIGYDPAIALYELALSADLKACSLLDMDADEELTLLRGLATFRLIQAQALGGDVNAAKETLAAWAEASPEDIYTEVATRWLESLQTGDSPSTACIQVAPLLADHPELWQATDQFGFNHPALAAGQICYSP